MEKSKNLEGEIQITKTMPEDARGAVNVLYKTWLDTYPNEEFGITVEDIKESYKNSLTEEGINKQKERISSTPENQFRISAKYNDEVVGIARATVEKDYNQLNMLYILPEFQGRGIGQKIWNELEKNLDPKKKTIVQMAVYNKKAISFYKKLGFIDIGKKVENGGFSIKSGIVIPEIEMEMPPKE